MAIRIGAHRRILRASGKGNHPLCPSDIGQGNQCNKQRGTCTRNVRSQPSFIESTVLGIFTRGTRAKARPMAAHLYRLPEVHSDSPPLMSSNGGISRSRGEWWWTILPCCRYKYQGHPLWDRIRVDAWVHVWIELWRRIGIRGTLHPTPAAYIPDACMPESGGEKLLPLQRRMATKAVLFFKGELSDLVLVSA